MTRTSRVATAAAGLALCTLPILTPGAVADTTTPRTKAQIEHDEGSTARSDEPTKAQVEQREREEGATGGQPQRHAPSTTSSAGDGDAAAWQLALSAALGAAVTGGIVLTSRQMTHHRQAVAH